METPRAFFAPAVAIWLLRLQTTESLLYEKFNYKDSFDMNEIEAAKKAEHKKTLLGLILFNVTMLCIFVYSIPEIASDFSWSHTLTLTSMFDATVSYLPWGLGIAALIFIFVMPHVWEERNWRALQTVKQYLGSNPACKTNNGIRCKQCNSSSIRNFGKDGVVSLKRTFVCNHCGTHLYRNEV